MVITLLTDFGTQDTFVGVLKGVLKDIAPQSDVIDLTHQVPPQDVAGGAFLLQTAYRYFPPGTIHLAVVDPGVGGARRPVAAHIGDFVFVCPDNGLLSCVLTENTLYQAVTLDRTPYHRPVVSRTFHGRDIFAPVAGHLANGVSLETLGTPVDTLVTLPLSRPEIQGNTLTCHVVYSDVYGNVYTDLTEDVYDTWAVSGSDINVYGQDIAGPTASSYSDVAVGAPVALFGGSGRLEIAVRNGSARDTLRLRRGDTITLSRKTRHT